MAQKNYVEGCSMQRTPLLEANGFYFWKIHFETYIKSKDIDLWQVIQNDDFYFEIEDSETKIIKETSSQRLATLPFDELIGNLQVYEMILASDGVASTHIEEKVMPIALKANVTRGQTSNDSVCQDGSDEDKDEDKEEEFNSRVRTIWMLFKKGNRFERENHFGNGGDRFDRGHGNRSKGVGISRGKCIHGRVRVDSEAGDPNGARSHMSMALGFAKGRYGISVSALPKRPRRNKDQYACMTRSSTKELLTPFKEPEREFRSSRKLFKTLSLDESRSLEFNLFSDLEENSEEEEVILFYNGLDVPTRQTIDSKGVIPTKTAADAKDLARKDIDKVGEVSIIRNPMCVVVMLESRLIMEYLVKISKKACILELKRRHLKINDSDILYAVSIKEDTVYLCMHFTRTTKIQRSIRRCYECGGTDHSKSACPRLNRAPGQGGNHPNQTLAIVGGQGHGNNSNPAHGRAFMMEQRKLSKRKSGERPEEKVKRLMSAKAEEPKLEDIDIVQNFSEVFPDDLLGLPHSQEVKFRINLIPRAMPAVKSPYRLAPTEMEELSNQLKELQDNGFIRLSSSPWGAPFLGHVVNNDGIHVDPNKIKAVKNWAAPKSPVKVP
ncbi:hypothetical protein Tco_0525952 [Tanacetum coccineum]